MHDALVCLVVGIPKEREPLLRHFGLINGEPVVLCVCVREREREREREICGEWDISGLEPRERLQRQKQVVQQQQD